MNSCYLPYTINKGIDFHRGGLRFITIASLANCFLNHDLGLIIYATDPKLPIKVCYGCRQQNLMSASSDRGYCQFILRIPFRSTGICKTSCNPDGDIKKINSSLQKPNIFITRIWDDITRNLNVNVKVLKRFTQLLILNRNKWWKRYSSTYKW